MVVPMRIVEDVIRQRRFAVVFGRYTARYLGQGMSTSGAYVTTSGRDGVAQAADSVHQAARERRSGGDDTIIFSFDVGGAEAQAVRNAMEAIGEEVVVAHVAIQRMGQGEIPGGTTIAAMAARQWGTRVVQDAEEIGTL